VITDIPTPSDFEATAVSLLNLAWDAVSSLFLHAERSKLEQWDECGEVTDEFWAAAQKPLGNAQALVQQGVEFLLKARIAEVSPFLLLDRAVRDWPKESAIRDTKYAEFRTVDAQDLVRLFNTVRPARLDAAFVQRIEEQRKTRNTFIHSVDKSLRHSPESLWITILDVSHHLIGPTKWIGLRRAYLESTPASIAFSTDEVPIELAWESKQLLETLKPSEQELYLGIVPKARRYICYHCAMECRDADFHPQMAQLRPNLPDSTNVYCFMCEQTQPVNRSSCVAEGCKGNVIEAHDMVCLTCFSDQPTGDT
jgi:hypothetical protein